MTTEKIVITDPFFSAPAGSTLRLVPDSCCLQVCDICGKKKYCDYYIWDPSIMGMTGMDVCPTCSRQHEVME